VEEKPKHNRQVYYKGRNVKAEVSRNAESKNSSSLDPSELIADSNSPKAYYFPNNLSSYAAGNILRFSIYKYQGGGYKAGLERPGGADLIADLPKSDKMADIYLPEPPSGGVSYKPSWLTESGAMDLSRLTTTAMSLLHETNNKSLTDEMQAAFIGQGMSEVLRTMGKAANAGAGSDLAKIVEQGVQAGLGYYMQEYKEEAFRGISPRTFGYNFNLIPTSPTDLILISNIIQLFKWSAVPGLVEIPTKGDGTGTSYATISMTNKLFASPEIIQIRHMTKVKGTSGTATDENDSLEINPWINRHLPSVLTGVTVRYGSDRAQNLLTYVQERSPDPNSIEEVSLGAPLMYNLDLSFKELTVLTKAAINNGY